MLIYSHSIGTYTSTHNGDEILNLAIITQLIKFHHYNNAFVFN
jgi:hypothetical protein